MLRDLFGSLKLERLHGHRCKTMREAKDEVIDWVLWYNCARLHWTLHGKVCHRGAPSR